jgi:hypothetical protein
LHLRLGPGALNALLLRRDAHGVLAVGQASHAWVSGQLARAWGNEHFPAPQPWEEVCLAAEQHDTGIAGWDADPELDPGTGLPFSFLEMPVPSHLRAWRAAPARVLVQSRYAALLVAMHGRRLYARRDLSRMSAADAAAARAYLAEQDRFIAAVLDSLRDDPALAGSATPDLIARNHQLVWIWDYLSLCLCLRWAPGVADGVPARDGPVDLELRQTDAPAGLVLDPWPFAVAELRVRCEGRRLPGDAGSPAELRRQLAAARWETLELSLRPAGRRA